MDRMISLYHPEAFRRLLSLFDITARYETLVHRLLHGFPLSSHFETLPRSYTPKNSKSALAQPVLIAEYLSDEVKLGRMSGPFSADNLRKIFHGNHFVSSPLGTVDKVGKPGKFRIVRDASHSDRLQPLSVNDQINPDEEFTRWCTATMMADVVSSTPDGAQAASLDVAAAYRTIPVLPDHKRFPVCQIDGQFYLASPVSMTCPPLSFSSTIIPRSTVRSPEVLPFSPSCLPPAGQL